ncbi:MAG TPA: UrcA family protein [Sphingomicrobium sp.]|jgi:UrcA family protein|nr:UrcA family protein [Sphingomicrobium sp.]
MSTIGVYIRKSSLVFAAFGAATSLGMPLSNYGSAAAQSVSRADQIKSEEVQYTDLDLGKRANQAVLKRRIHSAAVRVCEFDRFLDTACADMATVDGWNQALRLIQSNASVGSTAAAVLIVSGPAH